MKSNILLLFEDVAIRAEVVMYAIVLAGRMNAGIIMLLLLRLSFERENNGISDATRVMALNAEGEEALEPWMERMHWDGVDGRGMVRVGEPASELLKFLAEGHDFNTVVWGGDKAILGDRKPRLGEHWMSRIMDKLGCPMVAP